MSARNYPRNVLFWELFFNTSSVKDQMGPEGGYSGSPVLEN